MADAFRVALATELAGEVIATIYQSRRESYMLATDPCTFRFGGRTYSASCHVRFQQLGSGLATTIEQTRLDSADGRAQDATDKARWAFGNTVRDALLKLFLGQPTLLHAVQQYALAAQREELVRAIEQAQQALDAFDAKLAHTELA
jgi:hypothetical protein